MICPKCNSKINENVNFCEFCGYKFPIQIIHQQPQQIQPIVNTIKPENNPNNHINPNNLNNNLGLKTFGIWLIYLVIGGIIFMVLNYLLGTPTDAEYMYYVIMGIGCILLFPIVSTNKWHNKHKVQVQ